jgi:formylglycine-generating enzyme required for sulfatase activity
MLYTIRFMSLIGGLLAGLGAGPAQAEKRLALSVGIDVYDNLPADAQLKKAVNDARAMAEAFRELGFAATLEENLPQLAFNRAWQRFLNQLEPGDIAAFFFAGHGVEIGGLNYLFPRDVPRVGRREERVLAGASIRFNELMDDLRDRKVRVSLMIVDACRENPFRDPQTRSSLLGGSRGLVRPVDQAKGSFVMYSARAGQVALDDLSGKGKPDAHPNSPYVRTLLPILQTPGLSLAQIAVKVREQVLVLTRTAEPPHEQSPAYWDELEGDFVLKAAAAADAKLVVVQPPGQVERDWAAVKDASSVAMLEAFIGRHKGTFEASLAQARIDELKRIVEAKKAAAVRPQPPPPPPKAVGPAVGLFTPGPGVTPLSPGQERALKRGDTFKECDVCPEMVVVAAGSFTMGSPANEAGRFLNEGPQRRVTIARPFAVGKFEVTFAEWDACVAAGGCKHRPEDEGWGRGNRPVIHVSWDDITEEYLPWLSRKTGKTYRLLTEAEWEYAARAGSTTRYHFGDNERDLCTYGNVADLTAKQKHKDWTITNCRDGYVNTASVGSFQPNAFGLYDMHGNVWEWVQDCENESYGGAPSDGSAWTAGDCGRRILRGGAWNFDAQFLRSAYRGGNSADVRISINGFRVGRTL